MHGDSIYYAFTPKKGFRVICLDSIIDYKITTNGELYKTEMEWLKEDLKKTGKPVIVFSHQTLDRVDTQDHNIKNASAVRAALEESGKVLAVISGHDHQGGYSNIKGIHYVVLNGNVGVNDYRTWDVTSSEKGRDVHKDNQFCTLEISRKGKNYRLSIKGRDRQPSYELERTL